MNEYIKKEDAIQAIENTWINGTSLCNADEAKHKIVNAPSADVVEVRHGHWIDVGADLDGAWYYRCSVCGSDAVDGYEYPLCPYCGAKMDEEQDHE